MAEKPISAVVKLQLPAGRATPGPPVGSTLGAHGINIPSFTKEFNEKTASQAGFIIPVVITIYKDRSFSLVFKVPPVTELIKKTLGLETASSNSKTQKVGMLTKEQVKQIAETKMPDLNANDIDAAMKMVAGTARSMGITVEE